LGNRYLIDIVFQQTRPKLTQPGLLIMDMDSTMIRMECIDEIARACGRYEEVSAVTREAMNGKIDFAQSLIRRVACLEGVTVDDLNTIKLRMPLMPGLANLVSQLKAKQWKIAVASGGFTFFADYLCDWLDLDSALSNTLEIENETLTGKVVGDVVDASAKRRQLLTLQQEYQLATEQTVAIGDGANDLPMLDAAGLGVAFHAKPSVCEQASAVITHQPLDAMLMLLD
jgi:phosphoserine phosphatase